MEKLSNSENIENLQKRKILWILSIVFSFLTILFALLNLFNIEKWWLLVLALVSAFLSTTFIKIRENIPTNKLDNHVDEAKIKEVKEKKKVKKKETKRKK